MVIAVQDFLSISKGYIMSATAQVVDAKMEPITAAPQVQQLVVTGQYLFDNFVAPSAEQVTRMDMIRNLIGKADASQMKGACDKMVELAVLIDYPTGKPKKAERGSKEQSAMNARTIILQSWGALTHVPEDCSAFGYTEKTGYQEMRTIAKKALDHRSLKWDGDAQKTDADREKEKLQRDNKAQVAALQEVQKDNPFDSRVETLQQWNERTFGLAREAMELAKAEQTTKTVNKVVEDLLAKHDKDTLWKVAEALFEQMGFSINVEVISVTEEEPVEEEEHA